VGAPGEAEETGVRGAWIAAVVVVLAGIIGAVAIASSKRRAGIDLASPASSIAGFPSDVDPSALVGAARVEAGLGRDARLTGIRVEYATSDGHVNLRGQGYAARVSYSFAGGDRKATVTLDARGLGRDDHALAFPGDAVADPECTVADVWRAAHAKGAPIEALAVITYAARTDFARGRFNDVKGWHFEITGTRYAYDVADPGCAIVDGKP
jgi:hypothetical protein